MRIKQIIFFVSLIILFTKCTSVDQALRERDKFSIEKKYALMTFECPDLEIARRVKEELRRTLLDYGFNLLEPTELNKLLGQIGLSEQDVLENYNKVFGKLKGIDGLIIGEITLENTGSSNKDLIASSSAGGTSLYIKLCGSRVINPNDGEILTTAVYVSEQNSTPEQVGYQIARRLSPH